MDFLTACLCLSIGSAVAWLIALYTRNGAYRLFWNTFFGMLGAFLTALAIARYAPILGVVGLLMAGPIVALLTILIGNAVKRLVGAMFGRVSA